MSGFWSSGTGEKVTGNPELAFAGDFSIIPNNTMVLAAIKSIKMAEHKGAGGVTEDCYLVTWKITSDMFKGREVTQKIKVFAGTPESIQRNLNMLKLLMDLCGFVPKHSNAPTEEDLAVMNGKILGIKIREWQMPKADGSMGNGNFVSEIHPAADFVPEIGTKMEAMKGGVDSALTRASRAKESNEINALHQVMDDEIPF